MKPVVTLLCLILLAALICLPSFADESKGAEGAGLTGSKAFQGVIRLLNDVSTAIQLLIIPYAVIHGAYLFIRRSSADEQEVRSWNRRLTIFFISIAAAVSIASIVKFILSYFI